MSDRDIADDTFSEETHSLKTSSFELIWVRSRSSRLRSASLILVIFRQTMPRPYLKEWCYLLARAWNMSVYELSVVGQFNKRLRLPAAPQQCDPARLDDVHAMQAHAGRSLERATAVFGWSEFSLSLTDFCFEGGVRCPQSNRLRISLLHAALGSTAVFRGDNSGSFKCYRG